MSSLIYIPVTPLQAAIIQLAVQEYQADFEALPNGLQISDAQSVDDLASITSAALECEEINVTIDTQLGRVNK